MREFFFFNGEELEGPPPLRALFYGEGVFETFRWKGREPVFLPKHLERLRAGAAFLSIPFPGENEIVSRVRSAVSRAGGGDLYVKTCLLSEGDPLFYALPRASSVLVVARPHAEGPETASLRVSEERRPAGPGVFSHKTLNYLGNVLARREALRAGFDDVLFVNADGMVAETSSRNVFWVRGNGLFTPSLDCGLLPGVTREILLASAAEFCCEARPGRFSPRELLRSDFVFLTSSTAATTYVDRVDGRKMPSPPEGYGVIRKSLLRRLGW